MMCDEVCTNQIIATQARTPMTMRGDDDNNDNRHTAHIHTTPVLSIAIATTATTIH